MNFAWVYYNKKIFILMCGIYLGEEEDNKIINLVGNRGNDFQKSVKIHEFFLFSSVLAIRAKIEQPIITENFSFLYNGEIYNETVSDTIFIKETIEDVLLQFKYDQSRIREMYMDIFTKINKYENELALVILFKDHVLFFKDDIGRKSLGYKLNKLQISSVRYQNEVDCLYLYIYDIKEKSLQKVLKQSDYVHHLVSNYHRIKDMIQQDKQYAFLKQENFEKRENLINEECSVHDIDKLFFESTKRRLVEGNIVVLFSGGIDSNVIVLYLILASKSDQKIILINSSLINSQDRENAKISFNLFKKNYPDRVIELVIVDLNCEMIKTYKKHLEDLIYPKSSKMDLNIAAVLYFGAKEARNYSKVCYLGSGADEIFCGYNKYKGEDFRDKMFFDLFTISYHNTTRDDRIISDNNIEPRFPFLDTKIIKSSFLIKSEDIKNKDILRKILEKYGLSDISSFKKVAMQYGSGIYKIEKHLYKND